MEEENRRLAKLETREAQNTSPEGCAKPRVLQMKSHGYVFLLTPIEIRGAWEPEIIPGHRLARANENQIKEIKTKIQQFNTNIAFSARWEYENNIRVIPGQSPGSFSFPRDPLPPEQWKYWIIEFEGTNSELGELESACELIANDIELGFHFSFHEGIGNGFGWNSSSLHTFFEYGGLAILTKSLTQADLAEINRNYKDIKKLSSEYPHIPRTLRRFGQLKWLPRSSEMVVIGLFSVIESLLSHAPKLTDSADSLSHQLRTKMPLLTHRFHPDLDYTKFFKGFSEDKLWTKLYAYRSKVVHGEDSRLTGDLKDLKDLGTVIFFLRETSKRLLTLSLREPQFMTDLKKC